MKDTSVIMLQLLILQANVLWLMWRLK